MQSRAFDLDEDWDDSAQREGIKFCRQCHNLLYPVEQLILGQNDEAKGKLIFKCKHCGLSVEADPNNPEENTVFKNDLQERAATAIIDKQACLDPTLARDNDTLCPKCSFTEAVFFQDTSTGGQEGMDMIYVCARQRPAWCGHWWHQRDLIKGERHNFEEIDGI